MTVSIHLSEEHISIIGISLYLLFSYAWAFFACRHFAKNNHNIDKSMNNSYGMLFIGFVLSPLYYWFHVLYFFLNILGKIMFKYV